MKRALIIGHTGQDGRFLSDLLREKSYEVFGVSSQITDISLLPPDTHVDIRNPKCVDEVIKIVRPHEVYYLAAVHNSSEDDLSGERSLFHSSIDLNLNSLINFLDAIKRCSTNTKLFYASSSHIFGEPEQEMQDELTAISPICVYGITKAAGTHICRYYRKQNNIFASVGILYNHESHLKAPNFVSQKIVHSAIKINKGLQSKLVLGDLDAKVDWGYAGDYAQAIFNILQCEFAGDYVVSSGNLHSIKDFLSCAFGHLGMKWQDYVVVDKSLLSKQKRKSLCGNNRKLISNTGWKPKLRFKEIVISMVDHALKKGD